jgi:hypothetical protein
MIAFGISSLFFAVLGVLVPAFGIFISGISGFLAWFSPGKGISLGGAAVIINLINIFFLSPGFMLVVHLEAQHRTPDQRITFAIWMFVLFIQISAIVVFLVNLAKFRIDFVTVKKSFFKEKPHREREVEDPALQPVAKKAPSGKEPDSNFWKSEFGNKSRDLEDIAFDGSSPHRPFLSKKIAYLKTVTAVASCACLAFLLVFLRPDLFPFLSYSRVFKILSKTFPENYLDRYKQQPPVTTGETKGASNPPPSPENPSIAKPQMVQQQAEPIETKQGTPIIAKGYWYVIELRNGETIITQNALESEGVIAALAYDGKEKRFRRSDVISVKKTTF